jgi:Tfp pilus assembly protein PilF
MTMFRHSLPTIVLSSLLGIALALLGYVGYLYLFPPGESAYLARGQLAYERGLRDLASQAADRATEAFREAAVDAEKVLEQVIKRLEGDLERDAQAIEADQKLQAQAFWLRAQALRGAALANAMLHAQPLPNNVEGGEGFDVARIDRVPVTWIPDAEMQKEALFSLRMAALRLVDDAEVQRTALRSEALYPLEQWNWDLMSQTAQNLLKLDPKDGLALYVMARYEFEQPPPRPKGSRAPSQPTPPGQRRKDRVDKALEYLARIKEVESPLPRWRTLLLEAQIRQWLLAYYLVPQTANPTLAAEQRVALTTILFDPEQGIRKRAEKEERFQRLTALDRDGLVGLHQLAIAVALDEARLAGQADAAIRERLAEALEANLSLARRLAASETPPRVALRRLLESAVAGVAMCQPYLAREAESTWNAYLESVQGLLETCIQRKAASPAAFVALTELLSRQASLAAKEGQSARKAALEAEIERWVEKALAYAESEKIPAAEVLSLHEQAARFKFLKGARRADIMPHLQVLAQSPDANQRAGGLLIEGVLAEREGKLEQAQRALEQVVNLDRQGDHAFRAHTLLTHIYLALGKPEPALRSLAVVKAGYAQFERLPAEEKAWLKEFLRDDKELTLLEIQARLQLAQQVHAAQTQAAAQTDARSRTRQTTTGRPTVSGRPGGEAVATASARGAPAVPPAVSAALRSQEQTVAQLIEQLPQGSPLQRAARQLQVSYLASIGRIADAENALASLKRDFPESIPVLRQEIALILRKNPKDASDRVDALIQDFLKNFPQETNARFLWAEWLINTRREGQAVAYLEDPANFPFGQTDPRVNALRAVAYSRLGEREKAVEAAQLLPADPNAEALKIRLAATSLEEMQKQVREEMTRYESNAVLTYMNAQLAFLKRNYVEAAQGFFQALEFTRVKGAARQGVLNALLSLALENPEKALELSTEMLQDHPGEPELLLGYAFACLQLDRVGDPRQKSDRPKDMSTALDQMEQAFIVNRNDRLSGPLAKARMWMWAGRPDLARNEVKRALAVEPKNDRALLLGARLAVESADAVDIGVGLEYLKLLKEKEGFPAEVFLLEGRLLDRDGKLVEAIRSYETYVDREPMQSAGYHSLVTALIRASQYERAQAWVQRWQARLPLDPLPGGAMVRILVATGKTAEARQMVSEFLARYEQAVKERLASLKPEGAMPAEEFEKQKEKILLAQMDQARFALAGGLLPGGLYEEAEALIREVLRRQPESVEANLALGDLYVARLQAQPDSPQRNAWLQQAKRAYETVYADHKGHLVAGNNLAWLLVKFEGDAETALRYLQEVRTGRHSKQPIAPERLPAELLDTFGEVYKALDKPDLYPEMRAMFEAARVRYPNDPRMYLHLANAYAGLGDKAKARSLYAAAISLASQPQRTTLKPETLAEVIRQAKALESALPK